MVLTSRKLAELKYSMDLRFQLSDLNSARIFSNPISILPNSLFELRGPDDDLFKRDTRRRLQGLNVDVYPRINAKNQAGECSVQDEVSSCK